MTPTPTAATPTPEELAVKLTDVNEIAMFYDPSDAVGLALDAATMIRTQVRQIEALRAEIERLTERNEYLLGMFPPHRAEGEFGGYCRQPDLPADADEADRLARKVCDAISGVFVGTDVDYRASHERRVAGYLRGTVLGKEKAEARATTAEAALSASLERERGMREAARPVADAFSALSAGWMGEVPDEQRLIAPDITVGQMRQFCAALQPKETADER